MTRMAKLRSAASGSKKARIAERRGARAPDKPRVRRPADEAEAEEASDQSSNELEFDVPLGEKSLIRVAVTTYQGTRYVNVRKYYMAGGEWKPTRKGIMIPAEKFRATYFKFKKVKEYLAELE